MLKEIDADFTILNKLIFSDDLTFYLLGRPINSCCFYIGKLKFACDCCLNNSINKFDINRKRRF